MRISPAVRKAALATAAVLVLGATGYFARQWIGPAERVASVPAARRGSPDEYPRSMVLLNHESSRPSLTPIPQAKNAEANARFDASAFQILGGGRLSGSAGESVNAGQKEASAAFDINSFYSQNRGRASEQDLFGSSVNGLPSTPALTVQNSGALVARGTLAGAPVGERHNSLDLGGHVFQSSDATNRTFKPNDSFQVMISDLRGIGLDDGKVARVDNEGRITLPNIGSISIAGMTEQEAEKAIGAAYRDAGIGQKSQVSVVGVDDAKSGEPTGPRAREVVDPAAPPNAAAQQNQNAAPKPAVAQFRKIIRSGEMEFEVESFDRSAATVNTVVTEENGFVATMDSARLENGKVRGQIVLRVPPERLDALVLKLRALGELKQQRIGSQDVSKQYTDLESELRAARAMEERLINIVKTGNGAIKDLLAAEKELGTWRTKIEKIVGAMRYFDNLVAMSTLNLTLAERDVKTASAAVVTETISAGLEVDDVDATRRNALAAIDEAKGRVLQSELKQHEAGQWSASIIAEVSPDSAGVVIDRFKQLGKVARLEADRKQSIEGNAPAGANLKTEKRDTRIALSIYNLANVAPRRTTTLILASTDVETAAKSLASLATKLGGRVVTSSLSSDRPQQSNAMLQIEVPSTSADAALAEIRAAGESISSKVAENSNRDSSTESKTGFVISIVSIEQIPPRQTLTATIESRDVAKATEQLRAAASSAGGKIAAQQLSQSSGDRAAAKLVVDIPVAQLQQVVSAMSQNGTIREQSASEDTNAPQFSGARARVDLTITTPQSIMAADDGFWHSIRSGLATSGKGLGWSLQMIVIGLCLVAPWAVLVWIAARVVRRMRARSGSVRAEN